MFTSKPNRILFFLRKIDCDDGIASFILTLAGGLKNMGVDVQLITGPVYCPKGSESKLAALEKMFDPWIILPKLKKIPDLFYLFRIKKILKDNKVTVINIHGLGMVIWARMLSIITGLPVVATYHPSSPANLESAKFLADQQFSSLERLILKQFTPDKIITVSTESAKYLVNQCPSIREKIVVVSGAVDDNFFVPPNQTERQVARARLELSENDIAVIHVGRLRWVKGQDLVINALRSARTIQKGLRCFFCGVGSDEAEMKIMAYSTPEDLKSFTFLGYTSIRDALWAADIFVLPSRLEGCALVVTEAMFAGVPVIRTPGGGASEQIIDGRTGILVPFENVPKLAEALLTLCDHSYRTQMQEAGLAHARENFSQSVMTQKTIDVYVSTRNS